MGSSESGRFVFLDTEFTGEHQHTTLVSLALVTEEGEQLALTFNDYDRSQVTDWLRENVLETIDPRTSVDSAEGFRRVSTWLEAEARGGRISLVSAGKMQDLILVFDLWRFARPGHPFHYLHSLPPYLNHAAHFDMPTIFFLAGIHPDTRREEVAGKDVPGKRHEALYDALVVRECFRRLVTAENFPGLRR